MRHSGQLRKVKVLFRQVDCLNICIPFLCLHKYSAPFKPPTKIDFICDAPQRWMQAVTGCMILENYTDYACRLARIYTVSDKSQSTLPIFPTLLCTVAHKLLMIRQRQ